MPRCCQLVLPWTPATALSCPDCLASTCCVVPADLEKYLASGKLSTAATQRVPAPPSSYGISDMPQPVTVPGAAMPLLQQPGGSLPVVGCWSPECCIAVFHRLPRPRTLRAGPTVPTSYFAAHNPTYMVSMFMPHMGTHCLLVISR